MLQVEMLKAIESDQDENICDKYKTNTEDGTMTRAGCRCDV